jgi:hypothetical protein
VFYRVRQYSGERQPDRPRNCHRDPVPGGEGREVTIHGPGGSKQSPDRSSIRRLSLLGYEILILPEQHWQRQQTDAGPQQIPIESGLCFCYDIYRWIKVARLGWILFYE